MRKLILVGSGPFEERYVHTIAENRFKRLSHEEREAYQQLVERLDRSAGSERAVSLARLGELADKADAYDPIQLPEDTVDLEGLADPVAMYSECGLKRLYSAQQESCSGAWRRSPAPSWLFTAILIPTRQKEYNNRLQPGFKIST